MAGSAFLLFAIIFLYARAGGGTFDLRTAHWPTAATLPVQTARWLFLAFFIAFAVKVPVFPLPARRSRTRKDRTAARPT